MQGDNIPFDILAAAGEEVGIPPRHEHWTKGELAAGKTPAKTAGQVLVDIFFELANSKKVNGRALVGVYQLPPTASTTFGGKDLDPSVVICIEHPLHWARVESRARLEGYRLARLLAISAEDIPSARLPDCRLVHLRPSRDYRVQEHDLELIEAQIESRKSAPQPPTKSAKQQSTQASTSKQR